jgi:hypothetical protein
MKGELPGGKTCFGRLATSCNVERPLSFSSLFLVPVDFDPSTRAPAMAGTHSLGIPPENRGVVLRASEASRRATDVVPRACGELHKSGLCDISSHDLESEEPIIEALE